MATKQQNEQVITLQIHKCVKVNQCSLINFCLSSGTIKTVRKQTTEWDYSLEYIYPMKAAE